MQVRAPSDLGQAIRQRRKQLGLDQRSLAERVGVSRQWIVEIEKGKPRAELGLVLRTLKALELQLEIGNPSVPRRATAGEVDLDALIEKARGRPAISAAQGGGGEAGMDAPLEPTRGKAAKRRRSELDAGAGTDKARGR